MAHIRRQVLLGFLASFMLCGVLPQCLHAQVAYVANDTQEVHDDMQSARHQSRSIDLRSLLEQLHQRYHLRFVYDDQIVKGVELPAILLHKKSDQLIHALTRSLQKAGLKLSRLGSKQYGITQYKASAKHQAIRPKAEVPDQIHISGIVKDKLGNPLIGVTVKVKGKAKGTVTNGNGRFALVVYPSDSLVVSYIGYQTQVLAVQNQTEIEITLEAITGSLNEVVVVGYGTKKASTVTGAVSQIGSDRLTVAPQVNVTNALAGKLPGLISKQTSGIPGADAATLSIRGFGNPLVIIDGIEGSLSNLDPNQIASISILKDASAAIYGARAGNGVILVTTKRGKNSEPTITFNSSYTLQGSTNILKPATSAERAQLEVDQWLNSGKPADQAPYTKEDIQKFRDGSDSLFLNTDWFDASIRQFAPQQNHNVSLSGGSEKVKYYGYFGYNNQETILKNNGGSYDRYNFQANFDSKVTENLSASLGIRYIYEHRYYAAGADGVGTNNNFWRDLIYAADPSYPLTLPDKTKFSYAGIPYGNPIFATNADLSGFQGKKNNITQFRGELRYDINAVPGLKLKGTVIYRNNSFDQKIVKKQREFYTYNAGTDQYTFVRSSQDPKFLSRATSLDSRLVQQYSLNYDRRFSGVHHISGMMMYEYIYSKGRSFDASRGGFHSMALEELFAGDPTTATNNSSSFASGRISWIGRLNYDYKDRYMFETILRADASSRFAKGHRWGYFPSVSIGWNINNEEFLKGIDLFDRLKLRASYGSSGYDAVANFDYLTGYGFAGSYQLGDIFYNGLIPTGLANINLSWEKMTTFDVGADFSLWQHKLYGTFDYFYRKQAGIPGTRANSLPPSFGAKLPTENLNSQKDQGFEIEVGTSGNVGKLKYDVVGNIAYSRSKWIYFDEPKYTDPDNERLYKKSGRYTDRRIGYIFDGLFTSQKEIDNWSNTFEVLNNDNSSLRPGDVKYKDLNGDHIINWRDQTVIGEGAFPHATFGLHLLLSYQNFDFSTLFQGAFDYTTNVNLTVAATEFWMTHYWNNRTNNTADALVPRPSGSFTNDFYSDYRNHNTTYVRLKNVSLGYQLPASLLDNIGITKFRVFIAGTNLWTVSSLSKFGVDPEMPEGFGAGIYYPQQYTLSVGCNLTF